MRPDPKTKTQLIILAGLAPVLIGLLWANLIQPAIRKQPAATAPAPETPPAGGTPAPAAPQPLSQEALDAIRRYERENWGSNPFLDMGGPAPARRPAASQATPTFRLQGIVWDPASPYAVIDGEVRAVGDTIKEFEVIDITQDRVTLQKGTEVLDLQLFPDMR